MEATIGRPFRSGRVPGTDGTEETHTGGRAGGGLDERHPPQFVPQVLQKTVEPKQSQTTGRVGPYVLRDQQE